jgi:hypothetical protein
VSHVTHMTNRRKLGLALVGGSLIVAATIQLLTGRIVRPGTEHEQTFGSGPVLVVVEMTALHYNSPYAIPLGVCFALGVACALWPSRR